MMITSDRLRLFLSGGGNGMNQIHPVFIHYRIGSDE